MNSQTPDGGPAFPTATLAQKTEGGMTLRDYFAGQALAGILSSASFGDTRDWLPQKAYALADAMLAERGGKSK